MKNLLFTTICFLFILSSSAQVWKNDKSPTTKSDTSHVTIDGKDYQKFIVVTYEEIDQIKLKEDFKRQKQELQWLREQRAELNERIDKLQAEMDQVKSLYAETAKKKKWKDIEVDTPDVIDPEIARREKLKADFLANPRRPK